MGTEFVRGWWEGAGPAAVFSRQEIGSCISIR
jgi:hypothetical protein